MRSTSAATAVQLKVGRAGAASASDSKPTYSSLCVRREKHVTSANIISVIYHSRRDLAIGDYEAKYRVICRV